MTVTVRSALKHELNNAGAIVAQAYIDAGLVASSAAYVETLRDAAGRATDCDVLVAVEADLVLGSATWCPPTSAYCEVAGPGEAEVRALGVRSSARGGGIGEALIRTCIDRTRAAHIDRLALCTMTQMHSAQRIYDRLGFVRTPQRDWTPVPEVMLLAYRLDLARS